MDNSSFTVSEISTGDLNNLVKVIMLQSGILDPVEAVNAVASGEVMFVKIPANFKDVDRTLLSRFFSVVMSNGFFAHNEELVDSIKAVIRNELTVVKVFPTWKEERGTIRFSITSDGARGYEWIVRLSSEGYGVNGRTTADILHSESFVPTTGITTEVVILKGELFSDNDRTYKNAENMAMRLGLALPNVETACLIREKLTSNDLNQMGLDYIVVMHKPVEVNFTYDNSQFKNNYHLNVNVDGGLGASESIDNHEKCAVSTGFAFVKKG